MSEIQRYTITSFLDGVENIKGEYVKLSDHEKAVRELNEDVVNLKVENKVSVFCSHFFQLSN